MTAIILLLLGIRLSVLRPTISQVMVAAIRWLAYRKRSAEFLARLVGRMPSLRCIRCFPSASKSDDLPVFP